MTLAEARAALEPVPDGFSLSEPAWARIATGYGEPHRRYHDFAHVLEVRGYYDEVEAAIGWRQPVELFAAVVYHDVVYRVGAADNEQRSAELAGRDVAESMPSADAARVAELIELTARHGKLAPDDVDPEAALFLDCDTAILGAEPARYDAYAAAVRAEYTQAIPAQAYDAGRAQFLARCLEKPRIYLSSHFAGRLEERARENLSRELAICSGASVR